MLRGALDCPELPLNVSRSYLQDNQYVKRIAQFIVKKVADKLNSLCRTDREKYEKVYGDIRIFIEYACLRDRKFYDRVAGSLLLRLTDRRCMTIDEYLEKGGRPGPAEADAKDETPEGAADAAQAPEGAVQAETPAGGGAEAESGSGSAAGSGDKPLYGTVYYTSDPALQRQYVSMLTASGIGVAVFDLLLDSQYLTSLEEYREGLRFVRVDSDISEALEKTPDGPAEAGEALTSLFRRISGNDKLKVCAEKMKDAGVPAVLLVSEQSRRFEDMMKLYAAPGDDRPQFPLDYTLTLNTAAPSFARLSEIADSGDPGTDTYASFVYRLALLAQKKLTAEELSAFLSDSYRILGMI